MDIQDFTLNLGADKIPYRIIKPEQATTEWCVLWLQGWTSSMDSHLEGVKRMVEASNIPFATMDYAGHGLHTQDIVTTTKKQQHEEVVAIFDAVKKLGYKKIIVIGGSFGGYMAALLSGARPVHAIIMRAPATYPDDEFDLPYNHTSRYIDYSAYLKSKEQGGARLLENKAMTAIKNYDGFVYILEHERDDVVPAFIPKTYFEAAKHGNYLIVPETKHSPKLMANPEQHYEYIEHLLISIIQAIQFHNKLKLT